MINYFLNVVTFLALALNVNAQIANASNSFTIKGKLLDKDTGRVVLSYNNYDTHLKDTAILINGEFSFSGKVNGACEALLWTNLETLNIDDKSVVRFLLDASDYSISLSENREPFSIITGSKLQKEKEHWDNEKASLLKARSDFYKKSASLYEQYKKTHQPAIQNEIDKLPHQKDSILKIIREKDKVYIRANPDSYLSGYLLGWHHHRIPIDSLQNYYESLSLKVKKSSIGKRLLAIIYPLTSDQAFRTKNPLYDDAFEKEVKQIKSVYDLSCYDSANNIVNLISYKGKYLVIDFWASWCIPCVENFSSLNQIIYDYRDYPVEFISISLDKDIAKWKASLNKYNLKGIQLVEPKAFESAMAVYLKVLWVPHYLIIGKTGNIIEADAPQALDPELRILLNKLLGINN